MDDTTFFDTLLQQFARTTRAEDAYWAVRQTEDNRLNPYWELYAVSADESETIVGSFENEVDADFVAGLHGCTPDLVRRLHAALDEADRLDADHDTAQQSVYALAVEAEQLRALNRDDRQTAIDAIAERDEANRRVADLERDIDKLDQDYMSAKSEVEYWKAEAHSYEERGRFSGA